jgi:hypothetical protein
MDVTLLVDRFNSLKRDWQKVLPAVAIVVTVLQAIVLAMVAGNRSMENSTLPPTCLQGDKPRNPIDPPHIIERKDF